MLSPGRLFSWQSCREKCKKRRGPGIDRQRPAGTTLVFSKKYLYQQRSCYCKPMKRLKTVKDIPRQERVDRIFKSRTTILNRWLMSPKNLNIFMMMYLCYFYTRIYLQQMFSCYRGSKRMAVGWSINSFTNVVSVNRIPLINAQFNHYRYIILRMSWTL